jgi:hypothetical protein
MIQSVMWSVLWKTLYVYVVIQFVMWSVLSQTSYVYVVINLLCGVCYGILPSSVMNYGCPIIFYTYIQSAQPQHPSHYVYTSVLVLKIQHHPLTVTCTIITINVPCKK